MFDDCYIVCLAPCMLFAKPIRRLVVLADSVRGAMHAKFSVKSFSCSSAFEFFCLFWKLQNAFKSFDVYPMVAAKLLLR